MNEKQQNDSVKANKNSEKLTKSNIKLKDMGLNLDKMEYQQIVLSDSNFPEQTHYRQNYYD